MNSIVFQLQEDDKLRESGVLRPYQIVSLWEVLRIFGHHFCGFCMHIVMLVGAVHVAEKNGSVLVPANPDLALDSFISQYGNYPEILEAMGLDHSAPQCKRLLQLIGVYKSGTVSCRDLTESLGNLNSRLLDELRSILMFVVPNKNSASLYQKENTFLGASVISKYSRLTEDASEAGNCFALGRYTACVFHLMRVMECCVQLLATNLEVPEEFTYNSEWQVIINKTRGRLKEKYPKEKDPIRIRHEGLLGHLETVKIAWRNQTMHPKATYTEEEARNVISAVRVFVVDFSNL